MFNTALDGVPASQSRGEMDVSTHAKVGRVYNLICTGHVKNGLGMNTGLVGESTESSDGVVERYVDLNGFGNHVFKLLELVQLVSRSDIIMAADDHSGKEATKRLSLKSVYVFGHG